MAGVVAVVVAALAAPAAHAELRRPRPTDAVAPVPVVAPNELQIYNNYATPASAYASRRAVVHYVVLGIDAPPLNDDDADGVPDYVEHVGQAADTAIAYFERRHFAAIRADEAGPDTRPDIYVSRFAPGYFGVAFPAVRAQGGAFVVVSNALDPSAERSLGSLYGTVAHELFHLVQFSYFPPAADPALPDWVLEGAAAAMESRVYPALDDIVARLQLRSWLSQPQRRLTDESYGSQLLWRFLDAREPGVLPAYLSSLARPRPRHSAAAALARTYARVTGRPFADTFGRFGSWLASDYSSRITPLRSLARGRRAAASVAPLAIHFLRIPRTARSVTLTVAPGAVRAEVVFEVDSEVAGQPAATVRLPARSVGGSLAFRIPPGLRRAARPTRATLVITNGGPSRALPYSVEVD